MWFLKSYLVCLFVITLSVFAENEPTVETQNNTIKYIQDAGTNEPIPEAEKNVIKEPEIDPIVKQYIWSIQREERILDWISLFSGWALLFGGGGVVNVADLDTWGNAERLVSSGASFSGGVLMIKAIVPSEWCRRSFKE